MKNFKKAFVSLQVNLEMTYNELDNINDLVGSIKISASMPGDNDVTIKNVNVEDGSFVVSDI